MIRREQVCGVMKTLLILFHHPACQERGIIQSRYRYRRVCNVHRQRSYYPLLVHPTRRMFSHHNKNYYTIGYITRIYPFITLHRQRYDRSNPNCYSGMHKIVVSYHGGVIHHHGMVVLPISLPPQYQHQRRKQRQVETLQIQQTPNLKWKHP